MLKCIASAPCVCTFGSDYHLCLAPGQLAEAVHTAIAVTLCTQHHVAAIQQPPICMCWRQGPCPNALASWGQGHIQTPCHPGARATFNCPAILVPRPHANALLSEPCLAALASHVFTLCLFTGEAADSVHPASAAIRTLREGAVHRCLVQ